MSVYLFCCSLAFCQLKDVGLTNPLEKYKQVPTRPKAETKALEGVIDPAEYVLGAGVAIKFEFVHVDEAAAWAANR